MCLFACVSRGSQHVSEAARPACRRKGGEGPERGAGGREPHDGACAHRTPPGPAWPAGTRPDAPAHTVGVQTGCVRLGQSEPLPTGRAAGAPPPPPPGNVSPDSFCKTCVIRVL